MIGINQKIKTFALNLQLQTIQILTNDVQMLILYLSYLITTVLLCILEEAIKEFLGLKAIS